MKSAKPPTDWLGANPGPCPATASSARPVSQTAEGEKRAAQGTYLLCMGFLMLKVRNYLSTLWCSTHLLFLLLPFELLQRVVRNTESNKFSQDIFFRS